MRTESAAGSKVMVTWREMAPVLLWAALVMAATALPYLWAISHAAPDEQFQGFIWGVDEGNVYLAWMRQASEGRVLLRNQYTTLPQHPHFLNVFLLALGRLTAWTGQPPAVIFHAARLLGGIVLLATIYLFAAFSRAEGCGERWRSRHRLGPAAGGRLGHRPPLPAARSFQAARLRAASRRPGR